MTYRELHKALAEELTAPVGYHVLRATVKRMLGDKGTIYNLLPTLRHLSESGIIETNGYLVTVTPFAK